MENIEFETPNGSVILNKNFEKYWITTINLPILGEIKCNKIVVSDLFYIFFEIEKNGLNSLIDLKDTLSIGGCYYPRYKYCPVHKKWDKCYGLSTHTFGIAID
ncbi:MAG: hypothetical protein NZ839_02860, partial [Endomicrobia bacterium]|nr:hypothetical protein [Endomicrobiia bacterium]